MRVLLGGDGQPIPTIALPDPTVDGSGVPISLLLEDGEEFHAADYISLGYTHYEVWCVGAAGGRGGHASEKVEWETSFRNVPMPAWYWDSIVADYIERAGGNPNYVYHGTAVPGSLVQPPVGVIRWDVHDGTLFWEVTPEGLAWLQNPEPRTVRITTYLEPYALDGPVIGGAGGGGGLHVVTGRLDELPETVIAEVGVAGADGVPGQSKVEAGWDPIVLPNWGPDETLAQQRYEFEREFPDPHPLVPPPGMGQDGGFSSFGDIAMASGGKGGEPSVVWVGGLPMFRARGGEGGAGGRTEAGGGAPGSSSSTANGSDGSWDGTVGKGGGGGRGGMAAVATNTQDQYGVTGGG